MATVQELGRRVRAVTNTRKLTKAMELVASARLRRAQERIEAMRPFADRMLELMAGTARASASVRSLPLLQRREVRSVAIVPVTGDRGLSELYVAEEVDRVVVVYNAFVSALTQRVTVTDVLPISEEMLDTEEEERERDRLSGDFIFEPEPEQILERLLPVYLETELYRALLESAASEQGA